MADPAVLSLSQQWPLPEHPEPAAVLLAAWSQPHRRYHDPRHLSECLQAATVLEAGTDERLALWFHDAVHTNAPGDDEAASAALAGQLLAPVLPSERLAEVVRLVLLTRHHRPELGDTRGAVVCDADLWVLGAGARRYAESVHDLRAELAVTDRAWTSRRTAQLVERLSRPIYHTRLGAARELRARVNLTAELDELGRDQA
jgi:predicted metal-dependent HD superfamily phosphohydrolase